MSWQLFWQIGLLMGWTMILVFLCVGSLRDTGVKK